MNQSESISTINLKDNPSLLTKAMTKSLNPQHKELNRQNSFRINSNKSLYYHNIPMPKDTAKWNMSASTLRHSSKSYQFNKSPRFQRLKINYKDGLKLQKPSTLGKRQTTMGYGKRVKMPDALGQQKFKQTTNCPFYQSNIYSLERRCASAIFPTNNGKTFGLGWKNYQAARPPHRSTVSSSYQVKSNPGPNRYKIDLSDKSPYNKIAMHHRLQMFTSKNANYKLSQPDPQTYVLRQELVSRGKYSKGIGYGTRTDFTKEIRNIPGPIYKLSGFCDKFTHLKVKLNQS